MGLGSQARRLRSLSKVAGMYVCTGGVVRECVCTVESRCALPARGGVIHAYLLVGAVSIRGDDLESRSKHADIDYPEM